MKHWTILDGGIFATRPLTSRRCKIGFRHITVAGPACKYFFTGCFLRNRITPYPIGGRSSDRAWLELAYQQHADGLQYLKVEPVYDGIRNDPRVSELIAQLRL